MSIPHEHVLSPEADPHAATAHPAPAHAATAVRLEALGLLAGGVAHDFNNILAVIRANVELARDALGGRPADVPMALSDLAEVDRAVGRASELVRQLLAFGRRQRLAPEPLDLNAVVRETLALVRVLVGDAVQVVIRPAPDLPRVRADRPQMEQVLVSLVLNGRDAIVEAIARGGASAGSVPGIASAGARAPGTLTVTTRAAVVAEDDVPRLGVARAGRYACLQVHDDGVGMDAATRARIFEPFFTTKAVDRGAGLGLAATWGIVRQSGGVIHVDSAPGAGSTFTVYLPATEPAPADAPAAAADEVAPSNGAHGDTPAAAASPPPASPFAASAPAVDTPAAGAPAVGTLGGSAAGAWRDAPVTVLLAEDDHAVRRATSRILRGAGYQVLEAGDGRSALALWHARAAEVSVLVADIRMPHLRGDALARLLRADRPELPVLLITGFGEEPGGLADAGAPRAPDLPVLGKPFSAAELLARVAGSLAAARGVGGAQAVR